MAQVKDTPIAFSVWGTPVKVNPAILANLLGLWGLLSWLAGRHRPERPWFLRVVIGFLSTVALLIADLGHAMAHIISARHAQRMLQPRFARCAFGIAKIKQVVAGRPGCPRPIAHTPAGARPLQARA